MNKQELIAKIAKDTGSSKAGAAAAVESLIDGITRSLKKGDSITFVGFGTFKTSPAQGAHRAQPADRRRHQDSEAPRRPLHRRQGAEERRPLADAWRAVRRDSRGRASHGPPSDSLTSDPPICLLY